MRLLRTSQSNQKGRIEFCIFCRLQVPTYRGNVRKRARIFLWSSAMKNELEMEVFFVFSFGYFEEATIKKWSLCKKPRRERERDRERRALQEKTLGIKFSKARAAKKRIFFREIYSYLNLPKLKGNPDRSLS